MVEVVYERGFAGATVTVICARAKVSRQTFYDTFESREGCFLAMIDEGYRHVSGLIAEAFKRAECWQDGVRDALAAILLFYDAEPHIARVWLLETLGAGSWALRRRERNLAMLTELIVSYWPPPPGAQSHPLAAPGVMASVLDVLQSHLLSGRPDPLISLLGPLMGLASAPYLGAGAVAEEIKRSEALTQEMLAAQVVIQRHLVVDEPGLPDVLRDPRAHRLRQCLLYLREYPGVSNRQVGHAIGVTSQTQISTLLARLDRLGLLIKQAGSAGHPNAWSLSTAGQEATDKLQERWLDATTNNIRRTPGDG